jgi:ArsR family transcriptional regulator, arsenate/arsenite/antimonite-responsive transcriptional repressor
MDESDLVSCMSALGHPTRWRVARILKSNPEGLPAGQIAKALNMRQNSLSPHLSWLASADIISGERRGREVIYRLMPSTFAKLTRQIQAFVTAR